MCLIWVLEIALGVDAWLGCPICHKTNVLIFFFKW